MLSRATANNVVYLGFSEGVKAAIVLNGRLYTGPFGNAGIIGRTIVPTDGGGRALEDVASIGRVCSAFDREAARGERSDGEMVVLTAIADRNRKFQAILQAAAEEAPPAARVVDEVLDALAIAACNLIYVLQPELLIIGGALSNLPAPLRPRLEQRIRRRLPQLISNHLLLRYARRSDAEAAVCGAADRFLQQYPTLVERAPHYA